MLTIESAKVLAVSYHAYRQAVGVSYHAYRQAVRARWARQADHNAVVCWGEILLKAQTDTGIELQRPNLVESAIKRARAALL